MIGALKTIYKVWLLLNALYMPTITGHGYVSKPLQVALPGYMITDYQAEVDYSELDPAFNGFTYTTPKGNAEFFNKNFKKTKWKTIGEMTDTVVKGCPCCDIDAKPFDVSALDYFTYQNNEYKVGFIESHHGPCSATIDGVQQFSDETCSETYPENPAKMKISYESCVAEKCIFTFYHIALQGVKVQFYKKCVAITLGGKGKTKSDSKKAPETESPTEGEHSPTSPPAKILPTPEVNSPEPSNQSSTSPSTEPTPTPPLYGNPPKSASNGKQGNTPQGSGGNTSEPSPKHGATNPESRNSPAPVPDVSQKAGSLKCSLKN